MNVYIPLWVIKLSKYALYVVVALLLIIFLSRLGGIWFALFALVVLQWLATQLAKITRRHNQHQ
jgi:hypothetical protein